jgi:manganese transport protein
MSDEAITYDPYALPPEDIQEPPTTLWAALRKIGPGIILAGTIVGSGELLLTTGLGAKHGFVFLWLILFSCVIKVFVQIELGRYAISSGKPTLGALQDIRIGGRRANWLLWWWFVMLICTVFQLGGMTGSIGQALNLAFPQYSDGFARLASGISPQAADYFADRREFPWSIVICLVTIALIFRGTYRRIEWLTTVIVVSVTVITVTAAASLWATDFPVRLDAVKEGLLFKIPPAGIADAFAVFGITGVGATELFYYPYWCLEKGYARYVGRCDGTPEWERRAKGWIRVMNLDAWVSMVVFTISTVAFYMMGAAVLHPQGLVPKGSALIDTLSKMYVAPFGDWARIIFLIGAGAVLFKTLYLSCAGNSRLAVDFLNLVGFTRVTTPEARAKLIQKFCLFFPVLALLFYIFARDPQVMVRIGGIAQAATLPMIAFSTVFFRYYRVDPKLKPMLITDILLWVAVIAITIVAMYTLQDSISQLIWPVKK